MAVVVEKTGGGRQDPPVGIPEHTQAYQDVYGNRPEAPSSNLPYRRGDTPFHGEGTWVSMSRKPGYTLQGWLPVPFRLQIPPNEDVARTAAYNWTNFDVIGGEDGPGERTRPGGRRLRSMTLQSLFMDWEPSWQVWAPLVLEPILAVRELEFLCMKGVKFQLRIRDPHMYKHDDVDMMAVITQAELRAVNGEPDARYFNLSIQEYVPTEAERKAVKNEVGPWTHTIDQKAYSSLYRLSKKYYKTHTEWQRIAAANKGMERISGARDLRSWSRQHKKKRIRIPIRPDAGDATYATVT